MLTSEQIDEYTITASSLKCYLSCPMKYKFKIIDCLCHNDGKDEQTLNMAMGSYGHDTIENNGIPSGKAELTDIEARVKMDALLWAYREHYGSDAWFESAQKEQIFSMPVKPSGAKRAIKKFRIAGIIDAITDSAVVDHKFISRFSPAMANECESSLQRIYCVAANRDTMVFNLVRKPLHKFNPDKGEQEYFDRIVAAIKKDEAAQPMSYFWRYEFATRDNQRVVDYFCQQISRIRLSMARNEWYNNWTSCVDGYGRQTCGYFNVCHATDPDFIIRENFVSDESRRHNELKRRLLNEQSTTDNTDNGSSNTTSGKDDDTF